MGIRSFTPGRSGIIAKAAAPTASNASRAAMSRYLPVESRLPVMAASHPDTSAPPTRARRSTRSPAAISTRPTRRMNVRPSTGRRRSTSGLRYLSQSTKRLVNLSAPATMGTSPYPIRNSVLASDGMLAPPTGRLRRRGGPGSPRGRLLLLDHRNPQLDPAVLRPAPHGRIGRHGLSFTESHCHRPLLRNAPLHGEATLMRSSGYLRLRLRPESRNAASARPSARAGLAPAVKPCEEGAHPEAPCFRSE